MSATPDKIRVTAFALIAGMPMMLAMAWAAATQLSGVPDVLPWLLAALDLLEGVAGVMLLAKRGGQTR